MDSNIFQVAKWTPPAGTPMVLVELVIDRENKDDCRAHTSTVWARKGDRQPYPEHLWPKLAEHPDVWRLVTQEQLDAEANGRNLLTRNPEPAHNPNETPSERAARLRAELAEAEKAEAAELEAKLIADQQAADQAEAARLEREKQEAAGQGTDKVVVTTDEANGTQTEALEGAAFEAAFDYDAIATPEAQAALTHDQIKELNEKLDLGINPRTKEPKMRPAFAAKIAERIAQRAEAVDLTGADDTSGPH